MSLRGSVGEWVNSRLPIDLDNLSTSINEPVPNHLKRWWWCLGGIPLYLFVIQALTGIMLAFYYVPEPARAYESVAYITNEVPFGWYIRGIHRWSSSFMIISVILHVLRVFFTGAYRKPRELTWIMGSFLLIVTLVFGFTGYSLIYEQLAYWGATVAANLTAAVPVVGEHMARFIRGGETIGPHTLTRFYIFHIGVMPTLIVILIGVHLAMIRLHGVTEFRFKDDKPKDKTGFKLYPDHMITELILGVTLLIVLSAFAVIFPAAMADKADPLITPAHIKPEWYFLFTFRWLKLTDLLSAILSLGLGVMLFVFWPVIESYISRFTKRDFAIPLGVLVFFGIIVLTIWEAFGH
jgi:quinol-cytochrome oxidoreductase complex cytochrome b subunit